MTRPNYDVIQADLTVARSAPGERFFFAAPITSMQVLQVDSACTLALGSGVAYPAAVLQTADFCPPLDEGLFVTNAAGVGLLVILVFFGDTAKAGVL